jgi:hypothetical protein
LYYPVDEPMCRHLLWLWVDSRGGCGQVFSVFDLCVSTSTSKPQPTPTPRRRHRSTVLHLNSLVLWRVERVVRMTSVRVPSIMIFFNPVRWCLFHLKARDCFFFRVCLALELVLDHGQVVYDGRKVMVACVRPASVANTCSDVQFIPFLISPENTDNPRMRPRHCTAWKREGLHP